MCLLSLAACRQTSTPPPTERTERLSVDLGSEPKYGYFLEELPAFAAPEVASSRRVNVLRSTPPASYRRIELRAKLAKPLTATLFGTPADGRTIHVNCAQSGPGALTLRWWVVTGTTAPSPESSLYVTVGQHIFDTQLPEHASEMALYSAPLSTSFCQQHGQESVAFATHGATGNLQLGPVHLLGEANEVASSALPPVILISIDTLRADYWDHERSRNPSLAELQQNSLRFSRAYSQFPTTAPSHSVMLSGIAPGTSPNGALTDDITFISGLRDAGYTTLGFVAGGYMRAQFGYGRREPGFALGFDFYIEGMHLRGPIKLERIRSFESPLQSERALLTNTHSLGPALERSLRWWSEFPNETAFHFVHGYDVHEYRSVARQYWDAAVAHRSASGGTPAGEIERCIQTTGIQMDTELVAHHKFSPGNEGFRRSNHGEHTACHRLIASLIYEARVRSAEDMLARYFQALRQLGIYDRALIMITSDHGESLLDESGHWGHDRALVNNYHVPLWIKLPNGRSKGTTIDVVVGLLDLRATIGDILGLPLGDANGHSMVDPKAMGRAPVPFASRDNGGFVMPDGRFCRWGRNDILDVFDFSTKKWRMPDTVEREVCVASRGGEPPPSPAGDPPPVPPELQEELRALGYVE